MSWVSIAIESLLTLSDVDQERLVFRRLRVGIANVRRQGVGDVAFTGHAFKTPVQRDPDGLHLLAVDVQRAQSAGHHGNRANEAALAADFSPNRR